MLRKKRWVFLFDNRYYIVFRVKEAHHFGRRIAVLPTATSQMFNRQLTMYAKLLT